MEKITKENYEKFMDDNFLDETLDKLMKEVSTMLNAKAKVEGNTLTIKIGLLDR